MNGFQDNPIFIRAKGDIHEGGSQRIGLMTSSNIRAIDRLFDVIEHLQMEDGAGVTELASQLDMPKSTIHSHLATLKNRGYVVKDGDDKYFLSLQFLVLGGSVRKKRTIYSQIQPLLKELAEETGESAVYFAEHDGKLVYVGKERAKEGLKSDLHAGFCADIHRSPEGKLYLSYLPEKRRQSIIDDIDFPIEGQVDRASLLAELEEIREQGYAYGDDCLLKNVTAISVPVIDNQNVLHGVVVVVGPSLRFDEDRIDDIIELLKFKLSQFNIRITYEQSKSLNENKISTK